MPETDQRIVEHEVKLGEVFAQSQANAQQIVQLERKMSEGFSQIHHEISKLVDNVSKQFLWQTEKSKPNLILVVSVIAVVISLVSIAGFVFTTIRSSDLEAVNLRIQANKEDLKWERDWRQRQTERDLEELRMRRMKGYNEQ